tara:strand:- start:5521 stop:5763 length:243 start_codon:yes stop_codon:yes gene_type:complete
MGSKWLDHVKSVMKANPGKAFGDILKLAKKTYKKSAKAVKFAVTGKSKKRRRKSKRRKAKKATKRRRPKRGKKSKRRRRR